MYYAPVNSQNQQHHHHNAVAITCPGHHGLKEFITPQSGFSCNNCGNVSGKLAAGSRLYSCRTCDYDICAKCFFTPLDKDSARPAVVAAVAPPKVAMPVDNAGEPKVESLRGGPSVDKLKQIQALLDNQASMQEQARSWFRKFDADRTGELNFVELRELCEKLNQDLDIPSVDDATVLQCIRKFDKNDDQKLNIDEFTSFYSRLLYKIRDHYGSVRLRREFFLDKQKGRPTDHFKIKKSLGQGAFGIVQLVEDKRSNRPMVLKTINKAKSNLSPEVLEQEIKNMRALDHPNVIKLFEYYEDYNNIYIVMESCEGGELLKVIEDNFKAGRHVNEKWTMEVFGQVLDAIAFCHSRGVMHKDLKAENIMLLSKSTNDKPHAVVIDFGLAEMFDNANNGRSRIVSGTPYTMAPEVWMAAHGRSSIGYKCDIYSLGCVMFHVLSGDFPIMAQTSEPEDWLHRIRAGPNWNLLSHCSPEAIDLCKKMMMVDERQRPTARECLNHPWLTSSFHGQQPHRLLNEAQMNALVSYSKKSTFEKAVLLEIATLSRAIELQNINTIFYELDSLSQGCLNRAQCATAFQKLGMKKEVAEQVAKSLDVDGDNRIDYSELAAGVISMSEDHVDHMLWSVFTSLDKDGSGSLEIKEIQTLLDQGAIHNIGIQSAMKDVEDTLRALDKDKSGKVTFDEFKSFFIQKSKSK